MNCPHCNEKIVVGDEVMPFNGGRLLFHRNCGLRGVIGSVAHIYKRCSCYVPGSTEGDPPDLTPRQAADAAVAAWATVPRWQGRFSRWRSTTPAKWTFC